MKKLVLRQVARAIKELDNVCFSKEVLDVDNITRFDKARSCLINILFSNGYELNEYTYRLIKSKQKREIV